jgi:glycosyltransferase involved in cell wall biosynthesis
MPDTGRLRALVVAHAFPETGGARVDKLVKLLPRMGLDPVVLASAEHASAEARRMREQEYPAGLEVHWVRSLAATPFTPRYLVRAADSRFYRLFRLLSVPERFIFVPDYQVRWIIPGALRVARALAREGRIDVVLTSSPPESTHLVGYYLRRVWGVPWVADFRDLWTEKGLLFRPPTPLHAALIRRLERAIFTGADHVIANTPENRERHLRRFGLSPDRVTVIPNGFDREDLGDAPPSPPRDAIYRIGYMGHFDKHGFPWRAFLLALESLVGEVGRGRVRLVHCGFQSAEVRQFVAARGLTDVVDWRGSMSHQAALRAMAGTDMLLSLLYENDYSESIVNAKLYPYLMLGRPILAVGPERGAMARIVSQTRTGTVVSPARGPGAILSAMRCLHQTWLAGSPSFQPDARHIARYDLVAHTETLASIMRGLLGRGGMHEGGPRVATGAA